MTRIEAEQLVALESYFYDTDTSLSNLEESLARVWPNGESSSDIVKACRLRLRAVQSTLDTLMTEAGKICPDSDTPF